MKAVLCVTCLVDGLVPDDGKATVRVLERVGVTVEVPRTPSPAEATCFGNVLVQARALGASPANLAGMRAPIRSTQPLRFYSSAADAAWAAAAARI